MSLKALANKVLDRDTQRDSGGTKVSHSAGQRDTLVGQQDSIESATIMDAEDFEERAAIVEYDGEVPQEWAAGLAHLCVMPCPEGVDVIRWRQVVDNAGRFADEWAVKASTLGWDTADIFGVDRHKPEAAIHTAGLIWLLGDKRIVAISADAVIVETPNGARQSFRPSVGDNDSSRRVLLWEMAD